MIMRRSKSAKMNIYGPSCSRSPAEIALVVWYIALGHMIPQFRIEASVALYWTSFS